MQESPTLNPRRSLSFVWDVVYLCNYRCPYCWWDDHWEKLKTFVPAYPSVAKWVEAWGRIARKHGPARINIVGGEPFVYPSFEELFVEISKLHDVRITTNLSISLSRLKDLVRRLDPSRAHLEASFHPMFASLSEVLEKVECLKSAGFNTSVYVVSYPPFLSEISKFEAACRERGIFFNLEVFRGTYQGRAYPESFSMEERELLSRYVDDPLRYSYQVELKPTFGKLCYSGSVYANIKPDGTVQRCGKVLSPLGNIFDPDFDFFPGPAPCPMTSCNCREYVYVAEEYEKQQAV